jgi:hypothetical protein
MSASGLIAIGVMILILGICLILVAAACDVLFDYLVRPIRGKLRARRKL